MSDLAGAIDAASEHDVDALLEAYDEAYAVAPDLASGGARRPELREAARIEVGLRTFLTDGGFGAFTDTFEDLGQLKQLPGIARPAVDGRRIRLRRRRRLEDGRARPAAQGDGDRARPAGRRSWRTTPTTSTRPGRASSGRTCSRSARRSPPGDRAARSTRCRSADGRIRSGSCSMRAPGPAVVAGLTDIGDRFRIVANVVDVVATEEALPRLPVARAVWRPRPDFRTTVEAWLTAGGAHHTVLSRALDPEPLVDFAEMAGIELHPDRRDVDPPRRQERDPLEPGLLPPGPWRLGCSDEPGSGGGLARDRLAGEPSAGRSGPRRRGRSAMRAGSTGTPGSSVIKPSGVPYAELASRATSWRSAVDDGAGRRRRPPAVVRHADPSRAVPRASRHRWQSSIPTRPEATAWAQACRPIPPFGTTHADHFRGAVPVTRQLQDAEVAGEYEHETGIVIVETLELAGLDRRTCRPCWSPGMDPFTWGSDASAAADNAVALELVAGMAGERWPWTRMRNRCPPPCSSVTSSASTGRPRTTASGRRDRRRSRRGCPPPWRRRPPDRPRAGGRARPGRGAPAGDLGRPVRLGSALVPGGRDRRRRARGSARARPRVQRRHRRRSAGGRAGRRRSGDPLRHVRAVPDGWRARVPRRPVCGLRRRPMARSGR